MCDHPSRALTPSTHSPFYPASTNPTTPSLTPLPTSRANPVGAAVAVGAFFAVALPVAVLLSWGLAKAGRALARSTRSTRAARRY